MHLMKVSDYAKEYNLSVQTVYKRIKRGVLDTEIKDGLKYVKLDLNDIEEELKKVKPTLNQKLNNGLNKFNPTLNPDCKEIVKPYKKMIKGLKKQIVKLESNQDKNYLRLESLFDKVMKVNQLSAPIEAEIIEKKKKKQKKKKKSKN